MRVLVSILIIVILLLPSQTRAGDVAVFLQGESELVYRKPVASLREMRFSNLVVQEYDYSCGAAALATILQFSYGIAATEQQVIEGMLAVSDEIVVRRRGFSLLDIKNYLERLGFRGRGYEVQPDWLPRIKVPTIALLDIKGYQHFVVLRKVAGDYVFLADPALGNRTMPIEEFVDGWNGILFAVIGDHYDRYSELANPEPPLSLRVNREDYRAPSSLELLDLGFRREELL